MKFPGITFWYFEQVHCWRPTESMSSFWVSAFSSLETFAGRCLWLIVSKFHCDTKVRMSSGRKQFQIVTFLQQNMDCKLKESTGFCSAGRCRLKSSFPYLYSFFKLFAMPGFCCENLRFCFHHITTIDHRLHLIFTLKFWFAEWFCSRGMIVQATNEYYSSVKQNEKCDEIECQYRYVRR